MIWEKGMYPGRALFLETSQASIRQSYAQLWGGLFQQIFFPIWSQMSLDLLSVLETWWTKSGGVLGFYLSMQSEPCNYLSALIEGWAKRTWPQPLISSHCQHSDPSPGWEISNCLIFMTFMASATKWESEREIERKFKRSAKAWPQTPRLAWHPHKVNSILTPMAWLMFMFFLFSGNSAGRWEKGHKAIHVILKQFIWVVLMQWQSDRC